MERYVVVTTYIDHSHVNQACAVLEHHGIPVMIEHIEVGAERASGFRVLVPVHTAQTAARFLESASHLQHFQHAA